ncbi:MAG TPA: PaaI family thioesterase [Actinomycetales bacterium]|nr:PaaI family thioesterase [Actinomycetales bacterium]
MTTPTQDEVGALFSKSLGVLGTAIDLTLDELSADRMQVSWTVTPQVHQPNGILHGGVHCWIVETVASVGGATWFGDRGVVVGVSNQTDFFRAVREGRMVSVGTPVHRGRSQQVWDVETRDDGGRLVARGQVRLHNLPQRDPSAG